MNKRELADKIRTLRTQRGLTQPELAAKCRVGQSQVSRWEAGTAIPSAPKIGPLANALGVDVATVFAWVLEASQDELSHVRNDRDELLAWVEQIAARLERSASQIEAVGNGVQERKARPRP